MKLNSNSWREEIAPVLVIEDEPSVLAFICSALERNGYRVVQAATGTEGLRLLREQDFSGVISDMRTPGGINGADVHAWITANRPEMISRLLFTTGDTASEETAAILVKTGTPCLEKPFRVQQLVAAVEKIVGHRH